MPWLINAEQLDSFRRNQKNLLILDATWHGADSRKAREAFADKHLAGARFFDLNAFHDLSSTLPNMLLLDEKKNSELLGNLGLRADCKIIFYDRSEFHSSCRALWILKMLGHSSQLLYILDGGLSAWEKYGGKLESGESQTAPKPYPVRFHEKYLRTLAQMKIILQDSTEQVLDLRHSVRFVGGAEPRPGLRHGHIPDSFCFPYLAFFDKEGFFQPLNKLRRRLEGLALDLRYPTVPLCGSGMTAAIANFALDILGNENNALYDGSWTEWGSENLYPGELSLDERPVESYL
ncbi:MAG TPA: sulfurtransferase [Gammaproteobacteria bacterium]|nr:sulfurtransferase [Gammaproteobacteria bacterium]